MDTLEKKELKECRTSRPTTEPSRFLTRIVGGELIVVGTYAPRKLQKLKLHGIR